MGFKKSTGLKPPATRIDLKNPNMICGSKTTARIDIEAMAAHDKSCVGVSQNGSGDVGMVRHVSSFPSPETGVSKNRGTPKWMVYNEKPY